MDLEELNWKLDERYQATQQKIIELRERAKQIEQRTMELSQQVTETEQQLIQVRANLLIGEPVERDAKTLSASLSRYRQELLDLEGERQATRLALSKLQTTLQHAETAAKKRVAEQLGPRYREAVTSLQETLRLAVEANDGVHQLFRHIVKQDLLGAVAGNPVQKVLLRSGGLNFLSGPEGHRSVELREWDKAIAPIVEMQ